MNPSAPAADTEEVIVMLTLQFKPGSAETVLARMVPSIHLTRAEPGCREFQMFEIKGNKDRFVVYERWQNQAALEWHWQQPYTKDTLALFEEHLVESLSETKDVVYLTDVVKREA